MTKLDKCASCHLYRDEHPDHVFVAMEWPDWCKCEPADWGYVVRRLSCSKYKQMKNEIICEKCKHDEACHQ